MYSVTAKTVFHFLQQDQTDVNQYLPSFNSRKSHEMVAERGEGMTDPQMESKQSVMLDKVLYAY